MKARQSYNLGQVIKKYIDSLDQRVWAEARNEKSENTGAGWVTKFLWRGVGGHPLHLKPTEKPSQRSLPGTEVR